MRRARPGNLGVAQRAGSLEGSPEAVGLGRRTSPARSLRWRQQLRGGGAGRRGESREGCAGELVTVCSEECNCPCDRGRRGRGAGPASSLALCCGRGAGFGWEGAEHLQGLTHRARGEAVQTLAAWGLSLVRRRLPLALRPFQTPASLFLRVRPGWGLGQ